MKRYAIIVAGGKGTRMHSQVPKQFMLLNGLPVLMYSIKNFYECHAEIILVLNASLKDEWKKLCNLYEMNIPHQLADGGSERTESVMNGLNLITETESLIAIHDAARPLVSKSLIEKIYVKAEMDGNAVPCLKIAESMRKISGENTTPVRRDEYVTIQTPQCFQLKIINEAYSKRGNLNFTDDSTLVESFGQKINLIEGERSNFKITQPEDIVQAECYIKSNFKSYDSFKN